MVLRHLWRKIKVMKKGQYYEKKTAAVVQKFNPAAQVIQGIRIQGKLSKVSREVDVQLVDPAKYDQIIFECKDHKAKVDIELVEALVTKLKDLDAKKGAIVSNSGFTKGAYNIAQAHGIDLLTIVDTADDKIRTQVFAPHIIEDTYISAGGFRIENMQGMFRLNPNLHSTPIKTNNGTTSWADMLADYWNETGMKSHLEPGEYDLVKENVTIIDVDGREVAVGRLTIKYIVERRYYLRNVRLLDTQGIYNVAKQTYQTNSIKSEIIKVQDFSNPKIWTVIDEATAKSMDVPVRMVIATPLPTKQDREADARQDES